MCYKCYTLHNNVFIYCTLYTFSCSLQTLYPECTKNMHKAQRIFLNCTLSPIFRRVCFSHCSIYKVQYTIHTEFTLQCTHFTVYTINYTKQIIHWDNVWKSRGGIMVNYENSLKLFELETLFQHTMSFFYHPELVYGIYFSQWRPWGVSW